MAIDLRKSVIDFRKKAEAEIKSSGLDGVKSQVVLVLDISKSMNRLFKSGVVQHLIERVLGLGAVLKRLKPLTVDQLTNDLVMDFD